MTYHELTFYILAALLLITYLNNGNKNKTN